MKTEAVQKEESKEFLELVVNELSKIINGKERKGRVSILEENGGHKYVVEVRGRKDNVLERTAFSSKYPYEEAIYYAQRWSKRGFRVDDYSALPKMVLSIMNARGD